MKYNLITISRQAGSGGRTVGRELAKRLGIPCYDSEIIEKTAEETNFAPEFIKDKGEYAVSGNRLFSVFAGRDINGRSLQDDIWIAQRRVILELAEQGPCVLVGRAADYILRDREDVLTVFLHSDMQSRIDRITKVYGQTPEDPEKFLKDKDKRRASYHYFYTDTQWGEAKNYDICLNSDAVGLDNCVDILEMLCK